MKVSSLKLANVLIATVLLASPFVVGLTASQYDPWADINEDGKIDIKDIAYTAKLFGTLGDPTKNVTVTNWPASSDVTVWYNQYTDDFLWSEYFNASGFGHLHVLTYTTGLTDLETVRLMIIGKLWNPDHTGSTAIVAYEIVFRAGSPPEAITIPVPSGSFSFLANTDGTGDGYIYLSFYMT